MIRECCPSHLRPFIHFVVVVWSAKNGRIRRVKSALILTLLCCAPWCGNSQLLGHSPYMPLLLSILWVLAFITLPATTSFVCKISPNGIVSAVNVKQSTGHEILDQAAIAALLRFLVMAVIEIVPNIRKEKG